MIVAWNVQRDARRSSRRYPPMEDNGKPLWLIQMDDNRTKQNVWQQQLTNGLIR